MIAALLYEGMRLAQLQQVRSHRELVLTPTLPWQLPAALHYTADNCYTTRVSVPSAALQKPAASELSIVSRPPSTIRAHHI